MLQAVTRTGGATSEVVAVAARRLLADQRGSSAASCRVHAASCAKTGRGLGWGTAPHTGLLQPCRLGTCVGSSSSKLNMLQRPGAQERSLHRKQAQGELALSPGQRREDSVHSWQAQHYELLLRLGRAVRDTQHICDNCSSCWLSTIAVCKIFWRFACCLRIGAGHSPEAR